MPPKNKKELEDEAKRLEQEQKKKDEEQARLALERKKYAGESLPSELFLPASAQLLLDFSEKPLAFIQQKLSEVIGSSLPQLSKSEKLLKLTLKQLSYYIKDSLKLFKLLKVKKIEGNESQLLKARAYVGLAFKLLIHDHVDLGGKGKDKQQDQQIFKQELANLVQDGENKQKVYEIQDIEVVLHSIKKAYFNHFLLLSSYNKFPERIEIVEQHIYIASPTVFTNSKQTNFIDLNLKPRDQNLGAES